jgi:hypothetical protein
MTSSAKATSDCGIVRPSASAVFKLISAILKLMKYAQLGGYTQAAAGEG